MNEVLTTERIAQHTPGPWHVEERTDMEGYWIAIPAPIGRKVIAEIDTGFDEPWDSQQHANARLIAAAPDMLFALKRVRRLWAKDDTCEETRLVDEAIAKATGEHS